jgi:hypothetical protein
MKTHAIDLVPAGAMHAMPAGPRIDGSPCCQPRRSRVRTSFFDLFEVTCMYVHVHVLQWSAPLGTEPSLIVLCHSKS